MYRRITIRTSGLAWLCVAALTLLLSPLAHAQTFSVIHSFTGGGDGYQPFAGLTLDQSGNLYGTTTQYVEGTVFEMKHRNGSWTLSTLYQFGAGQWIPQGRVVQGPGGALYGTTSTGGNSLDCTEFGCGVRPAPATNDMPQRQLLVVSGHRVIEWQRWLGARICRSSLRCRRQYVCHDHNWRRQF